MVRFWLIFLVCSQPVFAQLQSRELRVAVDHWPPMLSTKAYNNGFAFQLVTHIFSKIEYSVTPVESSFSDAINGMKAGSFDVMPALWHLPERDKFIAFSQPYMTSRIELVSFNKKKLRTLKELEDETIGYVASDVNIREFNLFNKDSLVLAKSPIENFQNLLSGKAEYAIVDTSLLSYLISKTNADKKVLIHKNYLLNKEGLHIGISKKYKKSEELVKLVNGEIEKLKLTGTLEHMFLDYVRKAAREDEK